MNSGFKTCKSYRWTASDKWYYFLSLVPVLIGFAGVVFILSTYSIALVFVFLGLYFLTSIFQAGVCVGCPYRGKFCPAVIGIYIGNIISQVIYPNRAPNKRFIETNIKLGETFVTITLLMPVYWLFSYGWYYLAFYIIAILIHLIFFYKVFCPKCSYKETCPGGKATYALNNRKTR